MSRVALSPALKILARESARIVFGDLPVSTFRTGFKALKEPPIGPIVNNYYTKDMRKGFRAVDPAYRTELEQRAEERLDR